MEYTFFIRFKTNGTVGGFVEESTILTIDFFPTNHTDYQRIINILNQQHKQIVYQLLCVTQLHRTQ